MINQNIKKDSIFFRNLYSYYLRGGFICIFVENILNIFTTGSTFIFFILSCFFLDWDKIGRCNSENTCGNMMDYVIDPREYYGYSTNIFMVIFIIIFLIKWLMVLITLSAQIITFIKYRKFYRDELKIKSDELKIMSWNDVVDKYIREYDNNMTYEKMTQLILIRDNYTIAIVGTNLLKFY